MSPFHCTFAGCSKNHFGLRTALLPDTFVAEARRGTAVERSIGPFALPAMRAIEDPTPKFAVLPGVRPVVP